MTEPTIDLDALEKLALAARDAAETMGMMAHPRLYAESQFEKAANPATVLALIRALRDHPGHSEETCRKAINQNADRVLELERALRDARARISKALREFGAYSVADEPQDDDEWWYSVIRALDDRFPLASVPGVAQEGEQ